MNNLSYLIKQGIRSVWKNRFMSFASLCIMTVSLILVGMSAIVMLDCGIILDNVSDKNEISVYLNDDADIKHIGEVLKSNTLTEKVDFDTFCKSDFRAVKVKACDAVKKSEKLLRFTLDDGTGVDRQILSGIHKWYEPEDLVGKTIGYAGTELSEALIRSIMAYVGADSSDVEMIDVGFDLMSSMTTGNVDATIGCLVNHEVPQMEEEGFDVNWFELDDYGVPTYYEGVFLASDDAIENDADMLRAFLRASAKGFEDVKADPAAALRTLLDNQNEENFPLSETVETESLNTLLPMMETADAAFLSQSEACWQENIDWLLDQGLIDQAPAISDVMVDLLAE